jgi:signal peptidase I
MFKLNNLIFQIKKSNPRKILFIYGTIGVLLFLAKISPFCVAYNVTKSIEPNLMVWSQGLPDKGDYFLFSWLADDFNGLGPEKGFTFTKRLFCGPGDTLDTTGEQVFCNSRPGRMIYTKIKEHKLRPFRFKGVIPAGKYFAVGDIKESYDSLYWGFVDKSWITGRVRFWI